MKLYNFYCLIIFVLMMYLLTFVGCGGQVVELRTAAAAAVDYQPDGPMGIRTLKDFADPENRKRMRDPWGRQQFMADWLQPKSEPIDWVSVFNDSDHGTWRVTIYLDELEHTYTFSRKFTKYPMGSPCRNQCNWLYHSTPLHVWIPLTNGIIHSVEVLTDEPCELPDTYYRCNVCGSYDFGVLNGAACVLCGETDWEPHTYTGANSWGRSRSVEFDLQIAFPAFD